MTSTLLALALCPPAASAITFGLSEQQPSMFADGRYQAIGVDRVRYVAPWDALTNRSRASRNAKLQADAFLKAARADRVEVFLAFNPTAGSRCPRRPCSLPSVRSYTRAFRAWKRRYKFIKVISPWNEINHGSQPTSKGKKGIKRAAEYAEAVRKNCRGCTVVAGDMLDISNLTSRRTAYLKNFKKYLKQESPKLARRPIWGLHNYSTMNRRSSRFTKKFLRLVKGDRVWVTELGALVKFVTTGGRVVYPENEARQKSRLEFMIRAHKARSISRQVQRVYFYHWQGVDLTNPTQRFDSGVIRFDGTERPSYSVLLNQRKYFK